MRVIVAGAGPAGAAAAREASRRGHETVLLEASGHVGGLAASFEFAGVRVDLGSHRLHPSCDPRVMADLKALLDTDLVARPRHGRILIAGRWVSYPVRPTEIATVLPPRLSGSFVRDLTSGPFRRRAGEDASFAEVLLSRFGRTLCEELYFPFARKLWAVEPEELDGEQARRRVSAGSLFSVAARAARTLTRGPGDFSYPRGGFGRIPEVLCREAQGDGADLRLGCEVKGVSDRADGVAVRTEAGDVEGDLLLCTLPLSGLAALAGKGTEVEGLPARGMVLAYLAFDVDRVSEYDAHYVPDTLFRTSRVSEPKWYAGGGPPEGRTVLCVEIPADPASDIWSMDDASVAHLAHAELRDMGLPLPGAPVEVTARRVPGVYPVYTKESVRRRGQLLDWTDSLMRVRTFGRQGLFVHDNSHHALEMGYRAGACLTGDGFDDGAWSRARRRWEGNVVED